MRLAVVLHPYLAGLGVHDLSSTILCALGEGLDHILAHVGRGTRGGLQHKQHSNQLSDPNDQIDVVCL